MYKWHPLYSATWGPYQLEQFNASSGAYFVQRNNHLAVLSVLPLLAKKIKLTQLYIVGLA